MRTTDHTPSASPRETPPGWAQNLRQEVRTIRREQSQKMDFLRDDLLSECVAIRQSIRELKEQQRDLAVLMQNGIAEWLKHTEARRDLETYTPQEAARLLGCNERTIRRKIKSGEIPATRNAGSREYRIPCRIIDEMTNAGNVPAQPLKTENHANE